MKRPKVYYLQDQAIHKARFQLERKGILKEGTSLEAARFLAGKINLGIQSVSRLSLKQREILIDRLKEMGAQVRNPHIYESDLKAEAAATGFKEPRKVIVFSEPKEEQLRLVDTLAARVKWNSPDGYLRLCHKLFKAPRPRNSKEVTKLRIILQSMIDQQADRAPQNSPQSRSDEPTTEVPF